jgi:spore coat protein H
MSQEPWSSRLAGGSGPSPLRARRGQRVTRGAWIIGISLAASLAVSLAAILALFGGCAANPATARDAGVGEAGGGEAIPISCGPADPGWAKAKADGLFAATTVPIVDLLLPAAEWEALKAHAREEQYVPAKACFEGREVGTVGLRFKGSYGSLFNCFDAEGKQTCPRLSLKLKFDEYVAGQRFYGLKRLAFNAYLHDDSRMKEKLAYDLFRAMGIVAPRSAWAVVRVNGQSQGLYGMVEIVDGRFTADRWPAHPDGNLYKELWPTHATDAQITSALETNEATADLTAYRAFAQALGAAADGALLATLGGFMDLDYLARFLAVEDAVASYDGITYFWTDQVQTTNHNYYVYEESPTRFTLIPWDVEATFWINPAHAAPHWTVIPEDCQLTYPYWDGLAYAPGCDRVFRALAGDLDPWRAAARALLEGPFAVAAMQANIDRYAALIGGAARADPTPTKYTSFDGAVIGLREGIPALRARLEALIASSRGDASVD